MNIYFNEGKLFSSKALKKLKTVGNVIYSDNSKSIDSKKKCEILFVKLKDKIDKEFLSKFINLRIIVSPTTSITHIDQKICKLRNIKIIKLKSSDKSLKKISSTAELTIALILSLKRNIHKSFYNTKLNKIYSRYNYIGDSLSGLTIGIIGLGRIGKMVAKLSRSFNMNVIAYDIKKINKYPKYISLQKNIESIFKLSDIISLHISESEDNYNFVSKKLINMSKKKPLFINTSRGEFVDEASLFNALKRGVLSGLGLDVLKEDFNANKIKYLMRENIDLNILFTPHIGGCTQNEMKITEEIVVENLLKELEII